MILGINKWFLGIIIILLILCVGSIRYAITEHNNAIRLGNNYYAVSDSLKKSLDQNGLVMTTVQNQLLTIDELRKSTNSLNAKLFKEAELSNIKSRKIEVLSNIIAHTQIDVSTIKRDTLIKVDTSFVPMQYIELSDQWYKFYYLENQDDINGRIKLTVYDDILITKAWYREGFWLWRWLMPKKYETTVKNLNPYSIVNEVNVVEIKK